MTILTLTVPKGSTLSRSRKQAYLSDDVMVDVVVDEPKIRELAYRAILNKRSEAVSGPVRAKVRRG